MAGPHGQGRGHTAQMEGHRAEMQARMKDTPTVRGNSTRNNLT